MELTLRLSSAISPRETQGISRAMAIMLGGTSLLVLMLVAGVIRSSEPGPTASPTTSARAAGARFATSYGNTIRQVQYRLRPNSMGLTSVGGDIALALTDSANSVGASRLLKLDTSDRSQWQKQLVCSNGTAEDYASGASAQQLSDGGYVLGGNILGCGGSYIQHALVR